MLDGGELSGTPSTVVDLTRYEQDGSWETLCARAPSAAAEVAEHPFVMNDFENPPIEELYANRWRIWGVVMIGLFMALIDVTIVNISIPQLQRDLDAEVDTVSWVLNAYNIMFAVLLVSMGRLADQFGRKRFFLIGMSIFTVGSLLCALSMVGRGADQLSRRAGSRRRHPCAACARDHGAGVPAGPAWFRARDDGGGRERRRRAWARRSEECWSSSRAGPGTSAGTGSS